MRKTYEALDRIGFTDAVRISRADDTTTYTRPYANDTTTYYADPNGDSTIQDYYVQTPSSASMEAYEDARRQKSIDDPIGYDADLFEEWKKMRDGTIYYDTAACMSGPHIGDVNAMTVSPNVRLAAAVTVNGTTSY